MRLEAASVPLFAIRKVAAKMRAAGIPVGPTTVIMYAIGKAADIPDDKLIEFALPQRGRKSDSFLRELEDA